MRLTEPTTLILNYLMTNLHLLILNRESALYRPGSDIETYEVFDLNNKGYRYAAQITTYSSRFRGQFIDCDHVNEKLCQINWKALAIYYFEYCDKAHDPKNLVFPKTQRKRIIEESDLLFKLNEIDGIDLDLPNQSLFEFDSAMIDEVLNDESQLDQTIDQILTDFPAQSQTESMTIEPTLLQSKLSKRQRDFIAAAFNTIPIKEGKPFIKECWTTKVINQQKHEMVTLSYDNQTGTGYGLTKTKAREEARSDLMTKSGWTMETLELKYEKTFEEFHRVEQKKKPSVNKKPNARPTKNEKKQRCSVSQNS
ncbi:hypothetical protein HDE_01519 [Halotydeus destructor]|nr:hypothetical protein HDE_01519 [Halotydeus destructor]